MKKSKQSSNEIIAGGSIRRIFTIPVIVCIVLFAILLFTSTFSPADYYDNYSLIEQLQQEHYSINAPSLKDTYTPEYHLMASYDSSALFSAFGIILAALQFNFLLNKKSCYTQLSFAVGRRQLYFNKTFFPIMIVTSLCVVVNVITAILNIHYVGFTINLVWGVILNILSSMVAFITTYTITIAGHLFTARHIEAYLFIFAIYNCAETFGYMAENIFAGTLYGYSPFYSAFYLPTETSFTPNGFLVYPEESLLPDIGLSLVSLLVLIVILQLFKLYFVKRYKAENCGVRAKNPIALVITCTIIPLFLVNSYSYFSSYLVDGFKIPFTALFIIGIIICAVLALLVCLLSTFSPKKLGLGGVSVGIIVALHIVLLVIGNTGCFGYDTRLPKTDDIEHITVSVPFEDMLMYGDVAYSNEYFYESNGYNEIIAVKSKEDIEIVRNIHKAVIDNREEETGVSLEITYNTKDGETIYREYSNISLEATKEMLNLWDTEESKLYLKMLLNQATKEELESTPYGYTGDYYEEYDPYNDDIDFYNEDYGFRYQDFITPLSPSEDMYIISKDLHAEQITFSNKDGEPDFPESVSQEIMTALYKDACTLSAKDWFEPENQLGALGFDSYYAYSPKTLLENCSAVFYVNSKMTNTVKVLEKYDLMKYFACQREIEKAHLVDVNEVASWVQFNEYYETSEYHGTYFSQSNPDITEYLLRGCHYSSKSGATLYDYDVDYEEPDTIHSIFQTDDLQEPILNPKEITDLKEAEEMLENAYLAYNVYNNGDFLVIKYTDGTCSMLVIPK